MATMALKEAIELARSRLMKLDGCYFDILQISKPSTSEALNNLGKVISKLSPIMGNLIEFNTVDVLNTIKKFRLIGHWERQDPGFPDAIFRSDISPAPGFEIKAWFPLATEITARFKDSQKYFLHDETYVAILAWLPEYLLWGKPKIIGVCVVSGASIAKARDQHYHNPPDYIVLEPENTSERTANLQQTNTNGYKIQNSSSSILREAENFVASWGPDGKNYSISAQYQQRLRQLQTRVHYRLDTNFAKIDRIGHSEIEKFKKQILNKDFYGKSIRNWARIIADLQPDDIQKILNADQS